MAVAEIVTRPRAGQKEACGVPLAGYPALPGGSEAGWSVCRREIRVAVGAEAWPSRSCVVRFEFFVLCSLFFVTFVALTFVDVIVQKRAQLCGVVMRGECGSRAEE